MHSGSKLIAVAVLAVLCAAPAARAGDVAFGVQGSWGDSADLAVGARVIADLSGQKSGLSVVASFDYFFPGDDGWGDFLGIDLKYWELNGNLVYGFAKSSSVQPYVGTGLNYAHVSLTESEFTGISVSDSDVGINILGGLNFGSGRTKFFAEAKFEAGGGEQFVVTGGIRF